jgi:hypothetical protein
LHIQLSIDQRFYNFQTLFCADSCDLVCLSLTISIILTYSFKKSFMKKLTFLLAFAFVFFYGCNKQESIKTAADQQFESSSVTIYAVDLDGGLSNGTALSISKSDQGIDHASALKANNNQQANGHFNTQGGAVVTFSAMVNSGGIHGNVDITFGGTGGKIKLNTTGLVVESNQATIGGQIIQTDIDCECPYSVLGNYVYVFVEDNGEGNNAPSDRYGSALYWSPEELGDLTYLIPPSGYPYIADEWLDTAEESDQIQVAGGNQ